MITEVAGLREVRRPLTLSAEWRDIAATLIHTTLDNWHLAELVAPVDFAVSELLRWIGAHGVSASMDFTITWDQALLFVELHDRGGLIPEPHVSRVDAELAVRLLAPPAVEWGADLDSRGRRLWVAFAVPNTALEAMPPDEMGRML